MIEHQIKRRVKTFNAGRLEEGPETEKENTMRLSSFTPSALAGAIETGLRDARQASRRARLRRELARLPSYITRDIGLAPDQDSFVNFVD